MVDQDDIPQLLASGLYGLEHTPLASSYLRSGKGASQNPAHSEPMPGSTPVWVSAPDFELSKIVLAWPTLSEWTREQIRELMETESKWYAPAGLKPKGD